MPRAFPTVNFDLTRFGRCGNRTVAIKIAEATNVNESKMNAASVPNSPATNPPTAAPNVNITDQVTAAIAFAGTNSRSETIEGMTAVLAGSKKVENESWRTVSTYTSHLWSGRLTS